MRKEKSNWIIITLLLLSICFFMDVRITKADTIGNTSGNLVQGGTVCYYKGWIYYTCQNKIYKIKTNGTGKIKVFEDENESMGQAITSINIYKNKIYFSLDEYGSTAYSNTFIYSMNLNGKGLKKLADGFKAVVMDDWIYYVGIIKDDADGFIADSGYKGIYKMKLDGTSNKKIRSIGRWDADCLSGDGKYLYYESDGKVLVLTKQGKIVAQKKKINIIGVYNKKIFYVNRKDGSIYYSNLKFTNAKKVMKISNYISDRYSWSANVDDKYIYFCNNRSKKIVRVEYRKKKQGTIVKYKKQLEYSNLFLAGNRIIQDYTFSSGGTDSYFIDLRKKNGDFLKKIGKYTSL